MRGVFVLVGVLAASLTLNPALAAPPENDDFENAQQVTLPFSTSVDVSEAGPQFGERACWWSDQDTSRTVWYRVTAASADRIVAAATSEDISTILAVYTGPSLKELTRLGCRVASAGYRARVAWDPAVGETYHIKVGGYNGSKGVVDFSVQIPAPPPNDERAGAIDIPYAEPLDFEHISEENGGADAAGEVRPSCVYMNDETPTIWYRLTTPPDVTKDFIFHGNGGYAVMYSEQSDLSLQQIGCTGTPPLRISLQPSTTYYFQVIEPWYKGAPMGLHIHPTVVNDHFEERLQIASLPFSHHDNIWNATREADEPRPSCEDYSGWASTWFEYTSDVDRLLQLFAEGDDYWSGGWVSVYRGSEISDLQEVACGSRYSKATAEVRAGEKVYIQLGFSYSSRTELTLQITEAEPVSNDLPENAGDLSHRTVLFGSYSQGTHNSMLSAGEPAPSCGQDPGSTVWFSITSQMAQSISISTLSYDSILAVYDDDLNELVCNDDISATNFTSQATLEMAAGQRYLFSVSGTERARGWLTVRIGPAPPGNDDFSNASVIPGPPYVDQTRTRSATLESGEPQPSADCIGTNNPNKISFTVWYRYTPAEDMTLAASTFGNNLQTLVAVYTGDALTSLTQIACSGPTPDPAPGVSGARLQMATFSAQAGVTYHFQVGHRSTSGQNAVPFQLNRVLP